jgi:hypothetical protein
MFNQSKNGAKEVEEIEEVATTDVEKAVHVALGIPAALADVVNDAVERWTNSSQRDKDLKALREQLERAIAVAERKGVEVRKQLPGQVDRSLQVAEQRGDEVRKQAVEQARVTRERLEPTRRRVSKISDTTQEQIRKTQDRVRDLV